MIPAPPHPGERERLEALRSYSVLDTPPETEFDRITGLAAFVCQTPIATLTLVDEDRQWFKGRKGVSISETPREWAFCAHAILGTGLFEIPDALEDERFRDNPLVVGPPHARFYAGFPIINREGYALGTLAVVDTAPRSLSRDQRKALQTLAAQAMTQLEWRRELLREQRKGEAVGYELENAYERLRFAANCANIGFFDWEIETSRVYFSPEWKAHIGYADHEISDQFCEWEERVHPEDLPGALARVRDYLEGRSSSYNNCFRLRHKDGTYRWIRAQASLRNGRHGDSARLMGAHIDVTEQKVLEESLKLREQALETALAAQISAERERAEMERSLDLLLSNLPGVVYRCLNDPDWSTEFVSQGIERLTGFPPEVFMSHDLHFASLIHPNDSQKISQIIQDAVSRRTAYQTTYRIRDARGTEKWIWEQGAGVYGPDGDILALEGFICDVTELNQTQRAVERERDFSLAVLNSLPGVFYVLDKSGHFIRWNDRMETVSEYSASELREMPATELFDLEERQIVAGRIGDVFIQGEASVEASLKSKSGKKTPFYFTGRRIVLNGEEQLIGMGVNISDRLAAESALRASERRLRDLMDGLSPSVLVGLLDRDGFILELNEPALRAGGLRRDEAVGRHILDVAWYRGLPEAKEKVARALERARNGESSRFDSQAWINSEGVVEIDFAVQPLRNEFGEVALVVPSAIDITQRKQAEARLMQSEERFRLLVESSSDLITIVDATGTIQFQSPSVETILAYQPGELMGRNICDVLHRHDLQKFSESLRQASSGTDSQAAGDFRFRHKDGTWRILETTFRAFPDKNREDLLLLDSRDVTESRNISETLRQTQKLQAIGRLAGGVAHDFNNILSVINGHAFLAESEPGLPEPVRSSLTDIVTAVERAANLTKQLLTFSRQQPVRLVARDLNEIVGNAAKMLLRLIGDNVRTSLELLPKPLPVTADAGMMEQILINLIVNARDAMPNGGVVCVKTSRCQFSEQEARTIPGARAGSFASLTVADTGTGIAQEHLPRIFDPFFTTKEVGKGTGLGLATVYGIVEQHLGWINVCSQLGQGTKFTLYFPLSEHQQIEAFDRKQDRPVTGRGTILVAEDEPALRNLLQSYLRQSGYTVLTAETGLAALELWKKHRNEVQLLLTDVVMPDGMNGIELAQKLQREDSRLKVIFVSGYSSDIACGAFNIEEGVTFLQKPYSPAKLTRIIASMLGQQASR